MYYILPDGIVRRDLDWPNPASVHLDRDGSLKHGNREDEPVNTTLLNDQTFHSGKGSATDPYAVSAAQIRPWPSGCARIYKLLESDDFFEGNRLRNSVAAENIFNAGRFQNGETIGRFEAAEQIARE